MRIKVCKSWESEHDDDATGFACVGLELYSSYSSNHSLHLRALRSQRPHLGMQIPHQAWARIVHQAHAPAKPWSRQKAKDGVHVPGDEHQSQAMQSIQADLVGGVLVAGFILGAAICGDLAPAAYRAQRG